MTSIRIITICVAILATFQANHLSALTMYIEDGSYANDIKAEISLSSGDENTPHYLAFKIENLSNPIVLSTDLGTTTITPLITAFAFNLPDGIFIENLDVRTDDGTVVAGWSVPYVGMKTTIPTPDNHGFWDAGASVGKLFTSGSPDNGIAPGESYYFNFLLSDILLEPDSIFDQAPSFGPTAGGGGGEGGGPGKGKTGTLSSESDEETTEGGIPSLDWNEYFLVNMKSSPEGAIDFGLLVPESAVSTSGLFMAMNSLAAPQAVAAPEPSTLTLMAAGALFAAFAFRRRTSSSI